MKSNNGWPIAATEEITKIYSEKLAQRYRLDQQQSAFGGGGPVKRMPHPTDFAESCVEQVRCANCGWIIFAPTTRDYDAICYVCDADQREELIYE